MRLGAAFVVSLSTAACAAMGDAQCRAENWYQIGERDALLYGLRPQLDQYAAQCARFGVPLAEKDYLAGWIDGQRERERRMSGTEP